MRWNSAIALQDVDDVACTAMLSTCAFGSLDDVFTLAYLFSVDEAVNADAVLRSLYLEARGVFWVAEIDIDCDPDSDVIDLRSR